jgi:hypothetical protein
MEDQILKSDLASAVIGQLTHLNPKKAIEGLNPDVARKKIFLLDHSCFELLHHTVFWQDILLKNLDGKVENWFPPPDKNWPTEEDMSSDDNFIGLKDKFNKNLDTFTEKLENINLMDRIEIGPPLPPDVTYFRIILVFLQHTSYHIGQLVTIRKILGDWKED